MPCWNPAALCIHAETAHEGSIAFQDFLNASAHAKYVLMSRPHLAKLAWEDNFLA
jgi:hypothetical protein